MDICVRVFVCVRSCVRARWCVCLGVQAGACDFSVYDRVSVCVCVSAAVCSCLRSGVRARARAYSLAQVLARSVRRRHKARTMRERRRRDRRQHRLPSTDNAQQRTRAEHTRLGGNAEATGRPASRQSGFTVVRAALLAAMAQARGGG